jgi:hypothetical protein
VGDLSGSVGSSFVIETVPNCTLSRSRLTLPLGITTGVSCFRRRVVDWVFGFGGTAATTSLPRGEDSIAGEVAFVESNCSVCCSSLVLSSVVSPGWADVAIGSGDGTFVISDGSCSGFGGTCAGPGELAIGCFLRSGEFLLGAVDVSGFGSGLSSLLNATPEWNHSISNETIISGYGRKVGRGERCENALDDLGP